MDQFNVDDVVTIVEAGRKEILGKKQISIVLEANMLVNEVYPTAKCLVDGKFSSTMKRVADCSNHPSCKRRSAKPWEIL
jgi:hypothetical protein